MKMYYTSNYGDVNIEQVEDNVILETTSLTAIEERLIKQILAKYKDKIPEFTESDASVENRKFTIQGIKLKDVHKVMTKTLKKDKPVITALKFKDGRIEVTEELKDKDMKEVDKAVTTEKARKGCPVPSFMESEFRASDVLKEFLTEQQYKDFEEYRQIISKGNYSGKNYLITSRWCPKISEYGHVFDLVNGRVICAECDEFPPSEEMLSLKLMIEFKEKEFFNM